MRPRGVSRGHVRNDCATCNGSGGVGHECPACQGTGIPVPVGTWRGAWRVKPAPAAVRAAKAAPRLKVSVRLEDGSEQEVELDEGARPARTEAAE